MCIYFLGVILSLYLVVLSLIYTPEKTINKHSRGALATMGAILAITSWGYVALYFTVMLIANVLRAK